MAKLAPTAASDRPIIPLRIAVAIALLTMTLAAAVEHLMGRLWIAKSGVVKFWGGGPNSPDDSQQLADWYSFSHVIHGFVLYAGVRQLARRRGGVGFWFVIAVVLEATWEMVENSPLIIDRYRQTAAVGYSGDTVLNSMSDISFAILGFWLAARLPVWAVVTLAVGMEVMTTTLIRDGLVLNVIMLVHPFAAVRRWQGRG
jgi:hypothetical protein